MWVYTDIFALLKMDIAHLVSHALTGLTQLSIHRRACDMKVIRTIYVGERLNGVNKKPVSVKNRESSEPVPPQGLKPNHQALRQPLLWEYSGFRCIFYGSWTEMRSGSDCLLVTY